MQAIIFGKQRNLTRIWRILFSIFRIVLLVGIAYIILYPLLYMISMSFRSPADIYDTSVKWIPRTVTAEYFVTVWEGIQFPAALLQTILISFGTSILLMIPCSMCGYALARFKFPGSGLAFLLVLLTIIVPGAFISLSSYLNFKFFNPFGILSLVELISGKYIRIDIMKIPELTFFLPAIFGIGIRSGLYIYIFRPFFRNMPKELEEAAYIDGCGFTGTFTRIIVPGAIPVFVTCFLFSVVWHWNDYQISEMFLTGQKTLSPILVNITNVVYQHFATIGNVAQPDNTVQTIYRQIGSLLTVMPMTVFFVIFQRFFVESIERTGLVE